jgi:hypothetical protein
VATLFSFRAKFENYFSSLAALFKVVIFDKVTTSAKPKKSGVFNAFIDSF